MTDETDLPQGYREPSLVVTKLGKSADYKLILQQRIDQWYNRVPASTAEFYGANGNGTSTSDPR